MREGDGDAWVCIDFSADLTPYFHVDNRFSNVSMEATKYREQKTGGRDTRLFFLIRESTSHMQKGYHPPEAGFSHFFQ